MFVVVMTKQQLFGSRRTVIVFQAFGSQRYPWFWSFYSLLSPEKQKS